MRSLLCIPAMWSAIFAAACAEAAPRAVAVIQQCRGCTRHMQVYEAHGELVASTRVMGKLDLPAGATFDDYCSLPPAQDIVAEVPLNLFTGFDASAAEDLARQQRSSQGGGTAQAAASNGSGAATVDPLMAALQDSAHEQASRQPSQQRPQVAADEPTSNGSRAQPCKQHSSKGSKKSSFPGSKRIVGSSSKHSTEQGTDNVLRTRAAGNGRKVKARLWLGTSVPINQRQLLPLLEIMGTQNKYIAKVCHNGCPLCRVRLETALNVRMPCAQRAVRMRAPAVDQSASR